MFVNLSNHPSSSWSTKQLTTAREFGEIVDFSFPYYLDEKASEKEIFSLALEVFDEISQLEPDAVLCVGEYTFIYSFVSLCMRKQAKFKILCTTADIKVHVDSKSGDRQIEYNFLEFLEYSAFEQIPRSRQTSLEDKTLNFSLRFPSAVFKPEQIAATPCAAGKIIDDKPLCLLDQDDKAYATKQNIKKVHAHNAKYIILDGEFYTFFANASILLDEGFEILIKCSARTVEETQADSGKYIKTAKYKFHQYRNLQLIRKLLEKI